MILQSLNHLYERLSGDPAYSIASAGYSVQKIGFVVVIHRDGKLFSIQNLRDDDGSARQLLVPGGDKPTGKITSKSVAGKANFLRNDAAFMLGRRITKGIDIKSLMEFEAFRDAHLAFKNAINDSGFSSVCRFLNMWDPDDLPEESMKIVSGTQGVFQILGEIGYVHDRATVKDWWDRKQASTSSKAGKSMCLITGGILPVTRTQPKIKGVMDAQPSGASLVSFNCDAFTSYGKEQAFNAPVSEAAAFRYGTALNGLLNGPRRNRHRIMLGDTTVAIWTGEPAIAESWLGALFFGKLPFDEAQDVATLYQVGVLFKALREGGRALRDLDDNPSTPIYLLGLAPNAARLSVRFWHADTLGHLFDQLKTHHDDLRLHWCWDPSDKREPPEFPPAWMLLRETAREAKDIPPLLAGALMRAILNGTPYPDSLASAVIRRIRADRTINYCRAAILKAWLTRLKRTQGGIPVSLDTERTDPAYRLGRLFAVLEKTQEEAQPGINATIRDRFYSAASATPSMVFPRLLRTYQHHLGKLHPGAKVNREKLVQEIVDGLDAMPPHLNLEAQALFAIGYYHQRKALFSGNKTQETKTDVQE